VATTDEYSTVNDTAQGKFFRTSNQNSF